MDTLEIEHPQLTSYTLYVDGAKHSEGRCDGSAEVVLPYGSIEMWINPLDKNWGIIPRIRIGGFLVNPYLASITIYDHMLQFKFDDSFYDRYQQLSLQSIMDSIDPSRRDDAVFIEKYYGVSGPNTDIVESIRKVLDEKTTVHQRP